uniref:Uncharacterized protein n=1 Tax=Peronospora matthiolae TaxID=2874970 RepID=A0AAV1UQ47_9STRA
MRLAYTAVATLAALLSCSDSVPTAGNLKAVPEHGLSLVAHKTHGDDYVAHAQRLLREAHAQDESHDSYLFEERGPPGGAVEAVAANAAHEVMSETKSVVDAVAGANAHVKDGAVQEKSWLMTKLAALKEWSKKITFFKWIINLFNRSHSNHNHGEKNVKVSPSAPPVEAEKVTEKEAEVVKKAKVEAESEKKVDDQGPPPPYPGPRAEGDVKANDKIKKNPTVATSESKVAPLPLKEADPTKKGPESLVTPRVVTVPKTEGEAARNVIPKESVTTADTRGVGPAKSQDASNPSKKTEGNAPVKTTGTVTDPGLGGGAV